MKKRKYFSFQSAKLTPSFHQGECHASRPQLASGGLLPLASFH